MASSRLAARIRPAPAQEARRVVCLRPTCQLSAGTAGALIDAVCARVRTADPAACSVVLDLSATRTVEDDAQEALRVLCGLLAQHRAGVRLVLPDTKARAALDSAKAALGLQGIHPSVRAAILAAYTALPGPAFVTPAMRGHLAAPPEPLPVGPPAGHPGQLAAAAGFGPAGSRSGGAPRSP